MDGRPSGIRRGANGLEVRALVEARLNRADSKGDVVGGAIVAAYGVVASVGLVLFCVVATRLELSVFERQRAIALGNLPRMSARQAMQADRS